MNNRKVERVSRAICHAASAYQRIDNCCPHCEQRDAANCSMWQQFTSEAQAAINAMKGF